MNGNMKTLKLSALLVANQLDLKGIKSFFDLKPIADSSSELLYSFSPDRFQYYFNYGVIIFAGHSEDEIKVAVRTTLPYQKSALPNWLRDDYDLSAKEGELQFDFNQLIVDRLDEKVIRIAMLNLAQSVALDYYHDVSENLLTEIRGFTRDLELKGKLSLGRKAC